MPQKDDTVVKVKERGRIQQSIFFLFRLKKCKRIMLEHLLFVQCFDHYERYTTLNVRPMCIVISQEEVSQSYEIEKNWVIPLVIHNLVKKRKVQQDILDYQEGAGGRTQSSLGGYFCACIADIYSSRFNVCHLVPCNCFLSGQIK